MRWTSGTASALGLWLMVSPFALGYTDIANGWNDTTVGLLIAITAGWSTVATTATGVGTLSSIAAVAGLWVTIASFVFAHMPPVATLWNEIVVGLAVLALSAARVLNPGVRCAT